MLDRILNGVDRSLAYKLMVAHIVIIAISNYIVQFKFDIFGHPLAAAAFTFPLVVVLTDLTVRLLGKQTGRAVINLAFIPAILVSMAVVKLGGAPDSVAFRIGLGSGLAYFLSNLLDVYVFQYFREKYKTWWIAPTLSSVVSTFIDTYVFFFAAFAYGANEFMAANWHIVATNNSISKVIVSLLVILPVYGILLNYLQGFIEDNE
ncbi:MAG: queuosine precursor transporter [Minisyncoccia bacterium]